MNGTYCYIASCKGQRVVSSAYRVQLLRVLRESKRGGLERRDRRRSHRAPAGPGGPRTEDETEDHPKGLYTTGRTPCGDKPERTMPSRSPFGARMRRPEPANTEQSLGATGASDEGRCHAVPHCTRDGHGRHCHSSIDSHVVQRHPERLGSGGPRGRSRDPVTTTGGGAQTEPDVLRRGREGLSVRDLYPGGRTPRRRGLPQVRGLHALPPRGGLPQGGVPGATTAGGRPRARRHRAAVQAAPLPAPAASGSDSTSTNTPDWACIRQHESGDNYSEYNGGAYQFEFGTGTR